MHLVLPILVLLLPLSTAQECAGCGKGNVAAKRIKMINKSTFTRVSGIELSGIFSVSPVENMTVCSQQCDADLRCAVWEFNKPYSLCLLSTTYNVLDSDLVTRRYDTAIFIKIVGSHKNKLPSGPDSCLNEDDYSDYIIKDVGELRKNEGPQLSTTAPPIAGAITEEQISDNSSLSSPPSTVAPTENQTPPNADHESSTVVSVSTASKERGGETASMDAEASTKHTVVPVNQSHNGSITPTVETLPNDQEPSSSSSASTHGTISQGDGELEGKPTVTRSPLSTLTGSSLNGASSDWSDASTASSGRLERSSEGSEITSGSSEITSGSESAGGYSTETKLVTTQSEPTATTSFGPESTIEIITTSATPVQPTILSSTTPHPATTTKAREGAGIIVLGDQRVPVPKGRYPLNLMTPNGGVSVTVFSGCRIKLERTPPINGRRNQVTFDNRDKDTDMDFIVPLEEYLSIGFAISDCI